VIKSEASYQPLQPEDNLRQIDVPIDKESEPQAHELVSNYHDIAISKAEQQTSPELAVMISEVITQIDRQGIDSFVTFDTEKGKWPVSTVSVTEIFEKIFKDKVERGEEAVDVAQTKEKKAQSRISLIIPGFSPPPVGHPFTPWDYVYTQVFNDLPRLFSAWKRGEPLPDIKVQVLGSANSDWGEVTPEFLADIRRDGFGAHGRMVADYMGTSLKEADYIRLTGISMGSLIATEAMESLMSDAEGIKVKEKLVEFGLLEKFQATYQEMIKEEGDEFRKEAFSSGRINEVLQRMEKEAAPKKSHLSRLKSKLRSVFRRPKPVEGTRMMNDEGKLVLVRAEGRDAAEASLDKMQFVLDNPADHYYSNRLLRMMRAVQLPLGMGLDYAQVLARLPHYGEIYSGEPDFLEELNKHIAEKRGTGGQPALVPSDDEGQMKLKKSAFIAECLLLLKQPQAATDKRVFVRKGATDLTTSTFGDVMFSILNKLGKRRLFRTIGRRSLFTVSKGHQRDNFRPDKWERAINGGLRSTEIEDFEQSSQP
jgi:hypothetical protein